MTTSGCTDLIYKSITNTIINYKHWIERILEVKQSTGKGKLSFFGLCAPKEGRVEENQNVYNQLQEILNKTNINDYILLSGDLNASRGNIEVCSIVGIKKKIT
jgi:hypothetical protein